MSGAVRQMDADQMAGQHLKHKQIQQHLSEAAYPLEAARWLVDCMKIPQEPDTVARVITVTVDCLEDVGCALLEMQRWGDEGVVHRSLLRSVGPWRQRNMSVAWELYFQEQGLAPYIRCEHGHCQADKPMIGHGDAQTNRDL